MIVLYIIMYHDLFVYCVLHICRNCSLDLNGCVPIVALQDDFNQDNPEVPP